MSKQTGTTTETVDQAKARDRFWASLRKRIANDPQWGRRDGRV